MEDCVELNKFLIKENDCDLFISSSYYIDDFYDLLFYTSELNNEIKFINDDNNKMNFSSKLFSHVTYIYICNILKYHERYIDVSTKEFFKLNTYLVIKHESFYNLVKNYINESLFLKLFDFKLNSFFIEMFLNDIINVSINNINNNNNNFNNNYYYLNLINKLNHNNYFDINHKNKIIDSIPFNLRNKNYGLDFASDEEKNIFRKEILDSISKGSSIESFVFNNDWKKRVINDIKLELKNSNNIIKDLLDD